MVLEFLSDASIQSTLLDALLSFYLFLGSASIGYVFLRTGFKNTHLISKESKLGWSLIFGLSFSAIVVIFSLGAAFLGISTLGFSDFFFVFSGLVFLTAIGLLSAKNVLTSQKTIQTKVVPTKKFAAKAMQKEEPSGLVFDKPKQEQQQKPAPSKPLPTQVQTKNLFLQKNIGEEKPRQAPQPVFPKNVFEKEELSWLEVEKEKNLPNTEFEKKDYFSTQMIKNPPQPPIEKKEPEKEKKMFQEKKLFSFFGGQKKIEPAKPTAAQKDAPKLLAEHFDSQKLKEFEEPKKTLLNEKIPEKKTLTVENLKSKISEKEDTKNIEAQKLADKKIEVEKTVKKIEEKKATEKEKAPFDWDEKKQLVLEFEKEMPEKQALGPLPKSAKKLEQIIPVKKVEQKVDAKIKPVGAETPKDTGISKVLEWQKKQPQKEEAPIDETPLQKLLREKREKLKYLRDEGGGASE